MKASLICAVFSAALLCVLGLEPEEIFTDDLLSPTPIYHTIYQPSWSLYHATPFQTPEPCNNEISDEIFSGYRRAFYDMSAVLYKSIAAATDGHFVYSPHTSYLTLAALAEGTTGSTRQQMFEYLSLPEDICLREEYYHLAASREHFDNDIVLARKRLFVADLSIHVNKIWQTYVKTYTNLDTIYVPFKTNPVEIEELKKLFKVQLPNFNHNGNSFFLESLDYSGLWTSVLSDAVVEEGPFYNSYGEKIGVMEYMKVTKPVNIGFIPSMNVKFIDLPVGRDGRYRLFFIMLMSQKGDFSKAIEGLHSTFVYEIMANLKHSIEPVEIVIPKIKMTSEVDIKQILENVGYKSVWTDPLATRNISEPAALPSAYTQRVTITIDEGSARPSVKEYHNFVPPVHQTYPYSNAEWSEVAEHNPLELTSFVANKPFLFSFFDSESHIALWSGSFSKIEH